MEKIDDVMALKDIVETRRAALRLCPDVRSVSELICSSFSLLSFAIVDEFHDFHSFLYVNLLLFLAAEAEQAVSELTSLFLDSNHCLFFGKFK